jgi:hypothetical protein
MSKAEDTYSYKNIPRLNRMRAGSVPGAASYSGKAETTWAKAHQRSLSPGESIIVIGMFILGSAMQAYVNEAIEAVLAALFLLLTGRAIVALVFPNRKPEMRAFLLTYAVCIFVGGLAQFYSLAVFDNAQSTPDALYIIWRIGPEAPFRTLDSIKPIFDGPLAIVIWQQIYEVASWLGLKFGPYIGVMFNAAVMGLVGSIIVQIARDLFGDDPWRLRRVGTLVAANGLFILFGAVLLRDNFTTFFSTLVLFGIVRWLTQPKFRTLLFAAVLTGISIWSMGFLRKEAAPLIAVYWILAFLLLFLVGNAGARFSIVLLIIGTMFAASTYISILFQDLQGTQDLELYKYTQLSIETSVENSLGLRFVVNQPLPIRMIVGSFTLMISPIPLWANFEIGLRDYHWIRGYNGFYQVFVLPLVFLGGLKTLRIFRSDRKLALPSMFLLVYLLINTMGVAATSLELRHIGQFLGAMVILAALPDTRDTKTKNEIKNISTFWFMGVFLVHLAWVVLKIVR